VTRNDLEKAFAEAEASLRLEGFDLAGDDYYQTLRHRVLNGELSVGDARREVIEHCIKGDVSREGV
jgi:hypothetical protein